MDPHVSLEFLNGLSRMNRGHCPLVPSKEAANSGR